MCTSDRNIEYKHVQVQKTHDELRRKNINITNNKKIRVADECRERTEVSEGQCKCGEEVIMTAKGTES